MIELICCNCGRPFQSVRRSRRFCSCACSNAWNGAHREAPQFREPERIVWTCGGGVQSTAIAVLIAQGRLPKPDLAIMVDVGWESQRTYRYLREVTIPRLAAAGVTLEMIPASDYVDVSLVSATGQCNLPAFRKNADGTVSHFSTFCNGHWKSPVVRRVARERGLDRYVHWLGISTDEARRARSKHSRSVVLRYPLIDLGLSREDCAELIRAAGWPAASRTSCIICPQRTMFEWLALKVLCPEDFERACQVEAEIQARCGSNVFLSSRCRSLAGILDGE